MGIYIESILSALSFWWLIPIGLVTGMFLGAIPGFSSTNGLIILLPFTLGLQSDMALAFMVSLYGGSHMAGSIPAILLNVPGTGAAAATCLDGYPMTKKGMAEQALAISFVASALGGIISSNLTLLALPQISNLVYYFRSLESFIVVIFGIALIAQIATDNVLKGMLSGFFGLLIGGIGYDHVHSVPRATLGILELYDGVPRVAALVGLFAIAEALIMIEKKQIVETESVNNNSMQGGMKNTFEGVALALKDWFGIIRSSIIGYLVGIIPGAGATIGSFVSYQQALTYSSEKEKFGTGHPPGVVAAEAANNGLTSGSLIPMLALGIPGGGSAAVMLIVLQSHGVPIGPRLFQTNPQLAYGAIGALVVAYLFMLLLGLPFVKVMSKITFFPTKILAPTIMSFTLVGAFVYRAYIFDMYLALIFGIIGYIMKKTDYSTIALLLGVILGPLSEQYFTRVLLLGSGDLSIFFSTITANILWLFLILSIAGPFVYNKIKNSNS